MLEVKVFELGLIIQANCYVVSEDGHALIIDPGSKGRGVQKYIEEQQLTVDAICTFIRWMNRCCRIRS